MKYVTFLTPESPRDPKLGVILDDVVIDLQAAQSWAQAARGLPPEPLPGSLFELINAGQAAWLYARNLINVLDDVEWVAATAGGTATTGGTATAGGTATGAHQVRVGWRLPEVTLYPPLPRPMTIRDFYAFEQHVKAAYGNRGRAVPPEWYEAPAFYYMNPNAVFGPDEAVPYPSYTNEMDFELEIACVIGKPGRNLKAEEAEAYIFGLTIMNDWSARDVQRKEMKLLGPAKSKDFATSIGPWVVTLDSLRDRAVGRPGVFDLEMTARVNGREVSHGNFKDIFYSFGEMIERASADAFVMPGDVIGSGTVGTGCLLELTQGNGPWLQPGDVVELEIERLGVLRNRVVKES
jgi:2-keto-4-pentenoate hydratase/2-oxohepta-3-ene-1,7-dioic acid hydratase in catechol pathway